MRTDRPAAKPIPAENQEGCGQQKRRESKHLEEKIRPISADGPNPVVRQRSIRRWRGDVKSHVVWGIGNQGQCDEHCQNHEQKTDQLVEPLVFSRSQKAHEFLLSFWGRLRVAGWIRWRYRAPTFRNAKTNTMIPNTIR